MLKLKRFVPIAGLCLLAGLGTVFLVTDWLVAADPPRPEQWKKVDEAVNKGLPKTAIEELEPIIRSAMADKAYPEAIKAIAKKIALEGNIEGNKPEERITRMETAIEDAPAEMKPVMNAILAEWYWHYFQQNRYRYMQRTTTTDSPSKDILEWSLPQILSKVDAQFQLALSTKNRLRMIPVIEYAELLDNAKEGSHYRPTMYDLVAFEALNFYVTPEQAGASSQDEFILDPKSDVLASADKFLEWEPKTTDEDSRTLRAVHLLQDVMKFHRNDQDRTPFLDADLFRLQFAYNTAQGNDKEPIYRKALQSFIETNKAHELSALAQNYLAQLHNQAKEFAAAHKIASNAVEAYPKSRGGQLCYNLIQQIEAKELNTKTERVWSKTEPTFEVSYRNIDKVYFRLYKLDWTSRLNSRRNNYQPESVDYDERKTIIKGDPALSFSSELPKTIDYQFQRHQVDIPKGIKSGFYVLASSLTEDFGEANNTISMSPVWVSDLAVIVMNNRTNGKLEALVTDADSGLPLNNALVKTWSYQNNPQRYVPGPNAATNQEGFFSLNAAGNRSWAFLVTHKDQQLASGNNHYVQQNFSQPQVLQQTVLFTDRSIYRPGQTIQFKGICTQTDQANNNYNVMPNQEATVILRDVNGQEVTKQTFTTNDYGSFSGSFTAPDGVLTGNMTLQAMAPVGGYTSISVEEYKRPKFIVSIDTPEKGYKLGDEVSLMGKAMSYTGAAIGGAKVRYRVVREVRYPAWCYTFCYWRIPQNRQTTQEIADGTTTSNVDGSFPISFTAVPDKNIDPETEPYFSYRVEADVTDISGETRSSTGNVSVGYTAMQATVSAPEWLTNASDTALSIRTSTLDGQPQTAEGTLKIHKVNQPANVQRAQLNQYRYNYFTGEPIDADKPDMSNPNNWELGEVVFEQAFKTDKDGNAKINTKLDAGLYRAVVSTKDRFGKDVSALAQMQVLDPAATNFDIKIPQELAAPKWSLEPGEEFVAYWGTGYDKGSAFIEVEHQGKILQSFWTKPGQTQVPIKQAVNESMRGGFQLRVAYVRENRAYTETRTIGVPWSNKALKIKWEHFVSKLTPGQKETWTAIVEGPDAEAAVAEMVTTLYDASLDQYRGHSWIGGFGGFRYDYNRTSFNFENRENQLQNVWNNLHRDYRSVDYLPYPSFPADITINLWHYQYFQRGMSADKMMKSSENAPAPMSAPTGAMDELQAGDIGISAARGMTDTEPEAAKRKESGSDRADKPGQSPENIDLDNVTARKNLNETAFFFPQLMSNEDGKVRIEFTMPEALTEWRFLAFAHDKAMRSINFVDTAVTSKDLMVQPNAPRFLREGDQLAFTVKVSNQSDDAMTGKVKLSFNDARTGKPVDAALGITDAEQTFNVKSKESDVYSWMVTVPDGLGPITYKAVGATDKLSDGEENLLPVLSKRILVTESLPLPIRGVGDKEFTFDKLLASADSKTLKNETLTVQMTSNPTWYAVMALPYLMEYPHECSEQTFNRLYANVLARHIANSDPKIRAVFDQWKNTPALDSPLTKNQELKGVMLEETPWVQDSNSESEQRRNVGILFDDNRLNQETAKLIKRLADLQNADGRWPWFPGGPSNDYITLYITTGFGRLRHLGVETDVTSAVKSLNSLDAWMHEQYLEAQKHHPELNHLSTTMALYLYGRSFFLNDQAVAAQYQKALEYWLGQSRTFWLDLANRQSQAHLALALKRFGDEVTPQGIMKSIKERSVSDEELGMFWRDTELSWWWYRAPIETQAVMIEAFDEVMSDRAAVEDCKVWLLKQKQTQGWKTTKATGDAVYALLLRGNNQLSSDALVTVSLNGVMIQPEKVEVGTGFYSEKFVRNEIKPEMGKITVSKVDPGVSWGSVTWQYLEDVSKVTPHKGTPLTLEKKLYKRIFTKDGPQLEPIKGAVEVGDEIVTRVVLRTDRDMEYCHLKDHRGSGTEPVNVLSQYRYQDGLAYYESTKDTASHFFIDYLPKGTYVFEYSVRAVHKGEYPTGLANIECMYAPEFNSHSESITLKVK